MRRMLFAVGALAAMFIYLIWWVTYAGIHYTPRYVVRPPGVAGEVQGTSVRLLSLTRAEQLSILRKTNQAGQSFPTLVAYGSSPSWKLCGMIRGRLFTATSSCWVRSGGCGLGRPQGLGGPFQAAYRTISQWIGPYASRQSSWCPSATPIS